MQSYFAALAFTLAVPLPPDTPPPGVAVPMESRPVLAGHALLDHSRDGRFTTLVARAPDGTVTFVFQSPDSGVGAGRTPTFTVTGFSGVACDVTFAHAPNAAAALGDWRLLWDPQTFGPVAYHASRTSDEITFHLTIHPGWTGFDTTHAVVVRTDATDYRPGAASYGPHAAASFSPNPEPSSLALFGGCLAGLAAARRRHRHKAHHHAAASPNPAATAAPVRAA